MAVPMHVIKCVMHVIKSEGQSISLDSALQEYEADAKIRGPCSDEPQSVWKRVSKSV